MSAPRCPAPSGITQVWLTDGFHRQHLALRPPARNCHSARGAGLGASFQHTGIKQLYFRAKSAPARLGGRGGERQRRRGLS